MKKNYAIIVDKNGNKIKSVYLELTGMVCAETLNPYQPPSDCMIVNIKDSE